jgi:hypothetical protein
MKKNWFISDLGEFMHEFKGKKVAFVSMWISPPNGTWYGRILNAELMPLGMNCAILLGSDLKASEAKLLKMAHKIESEET